MARTWSLAATLSTGVATVLANRALVMNGEVYFFGGLHFVSSYPRIFKWDGSTLTPLTNSGSLPSTIDGISAGYRDICVFDGDLFIGYGNNDATSKDRIYRHTGGTSWTMEHELVDETGDPNDSLHFNSAIPTNQEGRSFAMDCDDTYMFIAVNQSTIAAATGSGRIVARTTGGSYSVVTMPGGGYSDPLPQLVGLSKGSRYGRVVTTNRVGASTYRAIERGGPGFSTLSGADVGDKRLIGYADGKSFWTVVDGSNWELKYSSNWGVTLTAAGNLEQSGGNRSNFVFKDCAPDAIMLSLGTDQAYTWDPATDTFVADGTVGAGLVILDYFVLNGILYALTNSSTANSMDVWAGGPVAQPAFYYGRNNLQFRVALPFSPINIGGLAVAYPFAVLGSGAAGAQMVAYAGPENEYSAFTNLTGALSTANPIQNFDATPWGDAAAAGGGGEESDPTGGFASNGKC